MEYENFRFRMRESPQTALSLLDAHYRWTPIWFIFGQRRGVAETEEKKISRVMDERLDEAKRCVVEDILRHPSR